MRSTSGFKRGLLWSLACLSLLLSTGCATIRQAGARQSEGQKLDPWENWNRKVFNFNEGLDAHVLKPVATVYHDVVPQLVRTGVSNFFGNVQDAWSAINHFLQGKPESGLQMVVRFNTNTVFGLFGLLDVASEAGIERQPEDFGQTLGVWGFGAGAYIVWPVVGPSSVRDSAALPLDLQATPATLFADYASRFTVMSLQVVNTRSNLLGASGVIDDIALDKYTFIRDAYLQRRRSMVFDGSPPESKLDDDSEPGATQNASALPAAPPDEAAVRPVKASVATD
jgi:phospholipid-binding lipoprotein MlaA